MIGEIRDFETAEIAIKAALTGHLVLSTLHTNDAPSTITRLLNMGVEPFLVTASSNPRKRPRTSSSPWVRPTRKSRLQLASAESAARSVAVRATKVGSRSTRSCPSRMP
jgi:Flp pilus assembly CpaF family ATPase